MLLVDEKGSRGVLCYSVNRYAKDYDMKDYDKNKE